MTDENYFERLHKNSFRFLAERFCDVNLIEYQLCPSLGVRARGSFNKYCPKPSGFDLEKMNQCKAKVAKFFEFTVSERVEEMNLELLESAKQINLTSEAFLRSQYEETCSGLL